jgi:hypothetical protein
MRASPPPVTVVQSNEFWLNELRAGRAFGRGGTIGPIAAQASQLQLFNPIGSGVQVVVLGASFDTDTVGTQAMILELYNTALTTDDGPGANLLNGGAAAQAHFRRASTAGSVFVGTLLGEFEVGPTQPFTLGGWVAELSPGQGLYAACLTLNVGLYGYFWWREGA